jgi:hypothetical protein
MSDEAVTLRPHEVQALMAQNRELRRLLEEHQWSGLTPTKSGGVCPECCGSSRNGHRPGCALAQALDAPFLS